MGIERVQPMQVHKGIVIQVLRRNPEDLAKVAPEWKGTCDEYIEALEAAPQEWFVGDKFLTDEEAKALRKA